MSCFETGWGEDSGHAFEGLGCGRSLVGFTGSNTAEGIDVGLL
jgi:hypothetical protein